MHIMIGACAKYLGSAIVVALLVSLAKLAFAGSASLSGQILRPTVATSASDSATIHVGGISESGPVIATLTRSSDDLWIIPAGIVLNDANFTSYQKSELFVDVHMAANSGDEICAHVRP